MVRPAYRSSFRIISFSPDQTSSTAQTFISTSPSGKAIWRTTSSVTSVATPELFFGQDTHIIPAGSIAHRNGSSRAGGTGKGSAEGGSSGEGGEARRHSSAQAESAGKRYTQ